MRNEEIASQAPEFRRDPVTGRWVVIAPERYLRPMSLDHATPHHRPNAEHDPCPFCPGQERETPNEVLAYRDPVTPRDSPGWRLRVVPNKFPAVRAIHEPTADSDSLFHRFPAAGRHEVVIECPEHTSNPATLSDEQFRDLFRAYRERLLGLAVDESLAYAAVFKNVGAEAGASLGHTHSQIIATPMVPDGVQLELDGAERYFTAEHTCVFCDLASGEAIAGTRVIQETNHFVAVAPFAPRFAYEVWVIPMEHASRYEDSAPVLDELAALMKRLVGALDRVLAFPAYNWFLHTAPLRSPELPHFHWHFEIMPRTSRPAGFEWGSGCHVVAVSPEQAASELRKAIA